MDTLLYVMVRCLVAFLRSLPLPWVARLGRAGGELFYWLDARHRGVAQRNLGLCFGSEKTATQVRALARENFRRIGENFASAVKTVFMSSEELKEFVEFAGIEKLVPDKSNRSVIIAIGHFGNFELFSRVAQFVPHLKPAATYRGLQHPSLDRFMLSLRSRSGCRFFERRTEGQALRAALRNQGVLLGLLADQHAGNRGLRLPFFDRDCSTSPASAIFALRYDCALYSGFCFRTSLGRWRIELGDQIATHENGCPRTVEAITREINHAFESAIRRDPANWFWVHNRWKPVKKARTSAGLPTDQAEQTVVNGSSEAETKGSTSMTNSKVSGA